MTMIMTKSLKVVLLVPLVIFILHYIYTTSNFALQHSRWLLSETGEGDIACSDTWPFQHVVVKDRGKTWDIQYRGFDMILIIYDAKTQKMACHYVSK